jgi:DNA-binding MarR family transcriptional regulator
LLITLFVFIMSEVLEKIFHSKAEVKIIRLFLNNPEIAYTTVEIAQKTKTDSSTTRKEVLNLEKAGFLSTSRKNKKSLYALDKNFVFLDDLKRLFFKAIPSSTERIRERVTKVGQIRLVIISGGLINSEKGRVDIFIVGEHINKSKLLGFLSDIEAEIGRSLRYVYMSNDEFKYRKNMFDKFVIDILEGPHKVLLDNLKSDQNL